MDIEYSLDALLARGYFHKKNTIFVEGKDDIPFWTLFFEHAKINTEECDFYDVQGHTIVKLVENIDKFDELFLIAMDRDYNYELKNVYNKRILLTPCHSIENIIYCAKAVVNYVRIFCGLQGEKLKEMKNDLDERMKNFKEKFFELLFFDILNQKYSRSIAIFSEYYKNIKVNSEISKCKRLFSTEEIAKNSQLKSFLAENFFFEIRGHFLERWLNDQIKLLIEKYYKKSQTKNEYIRTGLLVCKCKCPCALYNKLIEDITSGYSVFRSHTQGAS